MRKNVRNLLFLLPVLLATFTSHAQVAIDEKSHNPMSIGVGFEMGASDGAMSINVPLELRLGTIDDLFTFHVGGRVSFHKGGDDSLLYEDRRYDLLLYQPSVGFTQFSLFGQTRCNILHRLYGTLYVGLGYSLNINTSPYVKIDVPVLERINGKYAYTTLPEAKKFRLDDLINRLSHTLRLEFGYEMPFFDFAIFTSLDLSHNYNSELKSRDIYYDGTLENRNATLTPNSSEDYNTINLGVMNDVRKSISDIFFVGFSLRFYLGSGYFNQTNDYWK